MSWRAGNHRRWLVVLAVLVPTSLVGLGTFSATAALQHIRGTFSAAPDEVGWAVTAHIVAYTIMLPVSGWLTAMVGERRLFCVATAFFSIGSAAAGMAPSLPVFVAARIIQGLAGGSLIPASQSIVLRSFSEGESPAGAADRGRGMAIALWALAVASGSIAGPTIGGFITERLDWRWIFYSNVPLGLGALPLVRLMLDEPPRRPRAAPLDGTGLALIAIGVTALQTALERGEREDWLSSPFIVWCAVAAVSALVLLVMRGRAVPQPILEMRVLRNSTFTVGAVVMAVVAACHSSVVILSTTYTAQVMGYDTITTGLALAPAGIATALAMTVAGALNGWVQNRFLVAAGATLAAVGMYQTAGVTLAATFSHLVWPKVVFGFGVGLLLPALTAMTIGAVQPRQTTAAVGLSNLIRNVGASVGIALTRSYLERGNQIHQAHLVEQLEPFRVVVAGRMEALRADLIWHGADSVTANREIWGSLYALAKRQALFLSFSDTYRVLMVLFAVAAVALLLVPARRQS